MTNTSNATNAVGKIMRSLKTHIPDKKFNCNCMMCKDYAKRKSKKKLARVVVEMVLIVMILVIAIEVCQEITSRYGSK